MQFHHFMTFNGAIRRWVNRRSYGALAPMSREVLHISPREIAGERTTPDAIDAHTRFGQTRGLIVGGEWDRRLNYFNLTESGLFQSCRMRWEEGRPWDETPAYQSYLKKIKAGTPHHDAPTIKTLEARYARLDQIRNQIAADGALSEDYEDLVTVTINRNGELFWGPNGRHRICIALSLGLKTMPARTGLIHADAVDRFQELRSFRKARMRGLVGFYG